MPKVSVNGVNLYYEIHGSGEPIVLFMGLGGNIAIWDIELINALAERFKVIIFDNRGTGRSDMPDEEYSIELFADDSAALLDALGIESAYILGASMGGMTAQEFALKYPRKCRKLILCCTLAGGENSVPPTGEALAILMSVKDLSPEEGTRAMRPAAFTKRFIETNGDWLEEKLKREIAYPTPPHAFERHLQAAMTFDAYDRLPRISCPTLVMTGVEDILIPARNSEILAQRIPGAKLILFDNSAHGFMSERRDGVLAAIFQFIEEG
ncbi:MAG: alpha/beta hydrolase [Candidatus Abyssobacteria bacterium SURF_17]|uniref:Alpha/beta hydrolase n=1 Tax=Candidatus Abyssobacteria bacterium SURF_17 TaxID=2093361 RepID=A0A419EN08_9BACT|nr:MAG: alpha/beta hydrolase [Candidatus Abyssubacteria bacterium SURF_17]